jgi:hypothetical protein
MALDISINTSYGVQASYHNIARFDYSKVAGKINVLVASYADKAAREAGSQPLNGQSYSFDATGDFLATQQNIVLYLYDKLKTTDTFKDATDV